MNRRAFFGSLFGAAAIAADPEKLLWTPGKKLISIPKPVDLCDRQFVIIQQVMSREEFSSRYPLTPPFRVNASRPDDEPCASIINRLVRQKWNEDPAVRDQAERAIVDIITATSEAQIVGTGWADIKWSPIKIGDRIGFENRIQHTVRIQS